MKQLQLGDRVKVQLVEMIPGTGPHLIGRLTNTPRGEGDHYHIQTDDGVLVVIGRFNWLIRYPDEGGQ